MIQDLRERGTQQPLQADVCIIGSGAVGIAVALEFIGSGFSVVLLEGGAETREEDSQDPYRGENVGLPHRGLHDGRTRALGGTTTLWAGQALPFTDGDFRARDWVPHSGWPIGKTDLAPYYPRAEAVYQVRQNATYEPSTWPTPETPPPAYDSDKLQAIYSQFTLTPNFREKYRAVLASAPNVQVVTHANVTSLDASPNADAIISVQARSFTGNTLIVPSRFVVVACGGIETARLLLLSDSVEKNGVGNRHDVVGRYFQEHPFFAVENIVPADPQAFDKYFNPVILGEVRFAKKVIASETLQKEQRIHGVVGEIHYPADENDPLTAARQALYWLRRGKPGAAREPLGKMLRDPGRIAREVWQRKMKKQAASAGSVPPQLLVSVEQEPSATNRITLGETTDRLNQRRVVLHWNVSSADTRTADVFIRTVTDEWRRLGIATIDLEKALSKPLVPSDSFHHIGSTRMGIDPKISVVDAECRVHGYDNLYVAGSSVFPTGSFSNPTLTAIALALRTADRIKARLSAR